MRLISHRGNLDGRNPAHENTLPYISLALSKGYEVEVDVWYHNSELYLGHDEPVEIVSLDYLQNDMLWCHCKNIEALEFLIDKKIHCFFHQEDPVTLTNQGYLWTYPGQKLTKKSICVLPEKTSTIVNPESIAGVCSDFIKRYNYN